MVLMPVPGWFSASWNIPVLYLMIIVLLLAAIFWPITALVRKHYKKPFPYSGRDARLYRATRIVCIINLIGILFYALILSMFQAGKLSADASADPIIRIAQVFCLIGVIGIVYPLWDTIRAWSQKGRSWWNKISSTAITLACLAFVWFVIILRLVTLYIHY
jgi:hypothetical protein